MRQVTPVWVSRSRPGASGVGLALVAVLALGAGCSSSTPAGVSTTDAGSATDTDAGSAADTDAGSAIDTDAGPPPPQVKGRSTTGTVAGGTVMKSSGYRMVLTTGQGPGGNRVMSSPRHRLQGGLVGASEGN